MSLQKTILKPLILCSNRFENLLFIGILLISLSISAQETHKRVLKLMGSRFEITVVAQDSLKAEADIDLAVAEITRIEKLISSWDPNSQTSAINRNAGIKPVPVAQELYDLIKRAKVISELTDGAFDISYASMDALWKFDGSMTKMPDSTSVKTSVKKWDIAISF